MSAPLATDSQSVPGLIAGELEATVRDVDELRAWLSSDAAENPERAAQYAVVQTHLSKAKKALDAAHYVMTKADPDDFPF